MKRFNMDACQATADRALELATSGDCANISEIKARLQAEGYAEVSGQLYVMKATLTRLCLAAAQRRRSSAI